MMAPVTEVRDPPTVARRQVFRIGGFVAGGILIAFGIVTIVLAIYGQSHSQDRARATQPASNVARNIWVSETGLSTALNVSYMASARSLFGLVIGIALILAGIGFIVLAVAALPGKPPATQPAP